MGLGSSPAVSYFAILSPLNFLKSPLGLLNTNLEQSTDTFNVVPTTHIVNRIVRVNLLLMGRPKNERTLDVTDGPEIK